MTWIFHDSMTGALCQVNVLYMDPTAQQSASPSAPQPTATSTLALYPQPSNQMAQQLPQMASANQPMTPMTPQPAVATRPTVPVSPQQTPAVDQQVDWASKIAKVMREHFGLRPKQQSVMYRTPYPPAYHQIPLSHKYKIPNFTKFSGQGDVSTVDNVNRFILQCGEAAN